MARAMINPNAQIVRRATPAPPAIQPPPLPAPTGSGANAQTVTSSGILTTLGTLVGTAVGGPGVGTAIGSGLGKLGDRAFGFDDPELPGDQLAPTGGPCPGFGSVRVNGVCVNLGDLGPGGAPAITPVQNGAGAAAFTPTKGMYGAGFIPAVETRAVSKCPTGTVLGDDGICYKGLRRSQRMWDPGMKPLMTGGDRAAIARAKRAAKALVREQKKIRTTARELAKVS